MRNKIDIEELNYIIQDIKDDINSGTRIIDCPDYPNGHILIDINMIGIKFRFIDMLPYIEEASSRLEDMGIKMMNITFRFTDAERLKINSKKFFDFINSNPRANNKFIREIDYYNILSHILIRYEYTYEDSIKHPSKQSLIKKFKSYFESKGIKEK